MIGDVILVVGPGQLKLHVHSLIFKAKSKPITVMLGLKWTKSHGQPNRGMPMKILLPEYNAIFLRYIFAITHYQNQIIHDSLTAQDALEILIVADKYDIVDALSLTSWPWLRACDKSATVPMVVTAAAYLFWSPEAFNKITKALVLDDEGSSYLLLLTTEIEG